MKKDVTLTVKISKYMKDRIMNEVRRKGMSQSDFVRYVINRYLDDEKV